MHFWVPFDAKRAQLWSDRAGGHADGIINGGPNPLNGAYFNYPFIWECKALNAKNWRALGRNGLEKEFPRYSAQVAIYQAYLNLTNPALFSAINVDTCAPTLSLPRAPANCWNAPMTC